MAYAPLDADKAWRAAKKADLLVSQPDELGEWQHAANRRLAATLKSHCRPTPVRFSPHTEAGCPPSNTSAQRFTLCVDGDQAVHTCTKRDACSLNCLQDHTGKLSMILPRGRGGGRQEQIFNGMVRDDRIAAIVSHSSRQNL